MIVFAFILYSVAISFIANSYAFVQQLPQKFLSHVVFYVFITNYFSPFSIIGVIRVLPFWVDGLLKIHLCG